MWALEKSTAPYIICTSNHTWSRSGVNCPDPLFRDHIFVKINLQLINSSNKIWLVVNFYKTVSVEEILRML